MESIWKDSSNIPGFGPLEADTATDVLIIGGGLAGLLCGYMLAKAGVNYLLIEADRICSGVTGNTTAKITSQHALLYHRLVSQFGIEKARMYYEANQEALKEYRELAKAIPCDFEVQNSFVYATDGTTELEKEMRALEQIGAHGVFVDALPLPMAVKGAICLPEQAQFHPLKFAAGIAAKLNICEHTRAIAFDKHGVVTDKGRINASKIIVATHFPIFNKHGSYFLKLYQHRSYVLGLEGCPRLDGMYVDACKTGFSFRSYGDLLLLGGGSHRTGKQGGNWQVLTQFAKQHYPGAKEKYRWATQDCMSLDGVPYIGQYSARTPNLLVAAGFNKWGMTSSMVAAKILSDMVQGRENPYEAVFSPSRTILRPQLLANGLEAAVNLLTPKKPHCPHLGCSLKWNPYEYSWDCPCHGSRFTEDGKLLDGPSTADMKQTP